MPDAYAPATPIVWWGIPSLAALVAVLGVLGAAYAWQSTAESVSHARPFSTRALLVGSIAVGAWVSLCLGLAASGVLGRFELRPPPLVVLMVFAGGGTVALARSAVGKRIARGLPLWLLVAAQGFRLPLELVMHRAASDGTMPVVMSFSGYNFDILSGASALVVAAGLYRGGWGQRVARVWNVAGLLLLGTIVVIAVLATPVFHAFGPEQLNLWIADPPFVLLPAVLVQFALLGHLLIFRKLALR